MFIDGYLDLFFDTDYFGVQCYSVTGRGEIPFKGILDDNENRFESADVSVIGTEGFLTVKSVEIIQAQIYKNNKIRIDEKFYTVRDILKGVDNISKLHLKLNKEVV